MDGRLVAGYLRLASPGQAADLGTAVNDLVAKLLELILPRVAEVTKLFSDEGADPAILLSVARAIEEAGREDPVFEQEVIRLCDELAGRGALPVPNSPLTPTCPKCDQLTRSGHAFCDHCGTFLEWESVTTPPISASPSKPPPAVEAPSAPATGSEPALSAPTASEPRRPPPMRKSRFGGRRPQISVDEPSPELEMSGPVESRRTHAQSMIDRALSTYVQRGRLLFAPPEQMRQGRTERVDVAIAQHGGLDEQLRALAPGLKETAIHDLETTPFMEVDLQGPAFSIVSLQAGDSAEQLLRPTALWRFDVTPQRGGTHLLATALWRFDVTPQRGGTHLLRLRVAMRIPLPDRDERVSLPALERTVRVQVDAAYGGRRFIRSHWQWVVATAAGLGGAITAWIKLLEG